MSDTPCRFSLSRSDLFHITSLLLPHYPTKTGHILSFGLVDEWALLLSCRLRPDALKAPLEILLFGRYRPNRSGHLGRLRHDHHIGRATLLDLIKPCARLLGVGQHTSGAVNQQGAQVGVAALGDAPSRTLPPLPVCVGTSPSQAQNSRPDLKALASPMVAMAAVAVSRPTPGI